MFRKMSALMMVAALVVAIPSSRSETDSESRLEKLERAVDQLQKRNTELEGEVRDLKKRLATSGDVDANGNQKPKPDGKVLLDKPIAEEKPAVFVVRSEERRVGKE